MKPAGFLRTALLASCIFAISPVAAPVDGHGFLSIFATSAQAAEVKYSVNGDAVTSYDIARRAAFLRIQGAKGGTEKAAELMIDQVLKIQEGEKLGIRVAAGDVDAAFARFAKSNNMSTRQISSILDQAGVTARHFKDFIRAEMTWGQVMQVRDRRSGNGLSTQDVVAKMLQDGGNKPKSTEYVLQQVIFVMPKGASASQRKREAENLRQRFTSCETTRQFAKGLVDVTVRDLGRMLEPELPNDWKASVTKTAQGGTTPVRQTEKGMEFLAVCRAREVSDDRVAELKFQQDSLNSGGEDGDAYLKEVRQKAQIIKR